MQKLACHSYNKAAFTVSVVTNHSVLFVTFSVQLGFYHYMSLTVPIRFVKHTAWRSLIEVMIVKTTPDLFVLPDDLTFRIKYFFKIFRKYSSQNYLLG